MSKHRENFKSKGNPKIRIKTPVRTKLKKSSFLVNPVEEKKRRKKEYHLDLSALMFCSVREQEGKEQKGDNQAAEWKD